MVPEASNTSANSPSRTRCRPRVSRSFPCKPVAALSLDALCKKVGVGGRTIQRTFLSEVGMSFEVWRRQVRLMKGIELLVEGCPVKTVASDVGYRQPSAFAELFRQTLGTTPKVWVATLQAQESATTPNSRAMFTATAVPKLALAK